MQSIYSPLPTPLRFRARKAPTKRIQRNVADFAVLFTVLQASLPGRRLDIDATVAVITEN